MVKRLQQTIVPFLIIGIALYAFFAFEVPTAYAAVAYDNSGNAGNSATLNSDSYSHTINTASSTLIVASILEDATLADRTTTNCTYNNIPMFFGSTTEAHVSNRIAIYWLPNLPAAAATAFCDFNSYGGSTPTAGTVIGVSIAGTAGDYPINSFGSSSGTGETASLSITTVTDSSMVTDFIYSEEAAASDVLPGGSLHTERQEVDLTGENANAGTAGLVSPAGATTTSWTWTGSETWTIAGVALRPAKNCTTEYCTDFYITSGTSTWTAPANVASTVDVACWGGGGGGGGSAGSGGSGGGGGGAFASSTIAVTAGNSYNIHIAATSTGGAAGGANAGANGETSNWENSTLIACGGTGGPGGFAGGNPAGGAGGTTACSIGDVEFAGGAGGAGTDSGDTGGGGGAPGHSAGTGSAGSAGTTLEGGVGGEGGTGTIWLAPAGTGGNSDRGSDASGGANGGGGGGGGDNGLNGGAGHYGGGGGGGDATGGAGGGGMCQVTYIANAVGGGDSSPTPALIIIDATFILKDGSITVKN